MEEELKESLRGQILYDLEVLKQKTRTEDAGVREQLTKEIAILTEKLDRLNQSELDAFDKQERREADVKKNKQLYELEVKKQQIDWRRWGLDIGKVVAIGALNWIFYTINQRKLLEYEETGRVNSDGGRQGTRLPNPLNLFRDRI